MKICELRNYMLCALTTVSLPFLAGCGSADGENKARPAKLSAAESQPLVAGNSAFAFELYQRLGEKDGNLFISPYSISSALAMTYAGARGNTATQMKSVLRFGLGDETLHSAFSRLTYDLQEQAGSSYELAIANALWGQQDYAFLPTFLVLNEREYGAGLNLVDFSGDTEGARSTINKWVEAQTNDRIQELLQRGILDRETRLVLTNAIYFKGDWEFEFDKERTADLQFKTDDLQIPVPMMSQSREFAYTQQDSVQIIELPYKDEDLSMVVLLPAEEYAFDVFEASLTADRVSGWIGALSKQEIAVSLPRFEFTAAVELSDPLIAMGMTDAFGGADFSGMTSNRELYISAVVHKAFVKTDETGSEAAAATAVVMTRTTSVPTIPTFIANRPFVFLIRDRNSGTILFLGRVMNPLDAGEQ